MEGFPPPPDQRVTVKNWLQPPYNRWSFQHVRRLSPTAEISNGKKSPAPLETEENDILSFSFSLPTGKKMTIKEMLEKTYTDGFLVLQNGKIISEQYLNSMRADTRHLIWSCSKSILGTLAGVLVHQNKLDPNEKIVAYIPELEKTAFGDATVQQLLDMTVASERNPDGKFCTLTESEAWSAYDLVRHIPKEGDHGKTFLYSNPSAIVLGWAVERSSQTYLPELLSQHIWKQIGAEYDANAMVDGIGTVQSSCGFSMTLRDLGRFGQMILQEGFYNGKQVIPREWIDDTRHHGNKKVFKSSIFGQFVPNGSYRNMWWVGERGSLMALGIYGQLLYIDFDANLVVVKLSSQRAPAEVSMQLLTHLGILALADHLKNPTLKKNLRLSVVP
ncbi:MAG: serine hydrolase [Waddliaceae bacterium]